MVDSTTWRAAHNEVNELLLMCVRLLEMRVEEGTASTEEAQILHDLDLAWTARAAERVALEAELADREATDA